jgi:hypothetical protein
MRRTAGKWLVLKRDDFNPEFFVRNWEKSFDDYVSELFQPHSWGDQFALHALGMAMGYTVGIVQNGGMHKTSDTDGDETPDLIVVWVRRNHFDAVRQRSEDADSNWGDEEELQVIENILDDELEARGIDLSAFTITAAAAALQEAVEEAGDDEDATEDDENIGEGKDAEMEKEEVSGGTDTMDREDDDEDGRSGNSGMEKEEVEDKRSSGKVHAGKEEVNPEKNEGKEEDRAKEEEEEKKKKEEDERKKKEEEEKRKQQQEKSKKRGGKHRGTLSKHKQEDASAQTGDEGRNRLHATENAKAPDPSPNPSVSLQSSSHVSHRRNRSDVPADSANPSLHALLSPPPPPVPVPSPSDPLAPVVGISPSSGSAFSQPPSSSSEKKQKTFKQPTISMYKGPYATDNVHLPKAGKSNFVNITKQFPSPPNNGDNNDNGDMQEEEYVLLEREISDLHYFDQLQDTTPSGLPSSSSSSSSSFSSSFFFSSSSSTSSSSSSSSFRVSSSSSSSFASDAAAASTAGAASAAAATLAPGAAGFDSAVVGAVASPHVTASVADDVPVGASGVAHPSSPPVPPDSGDPLCAFDQIATRRWYQEMVDMYKRFTNTMHRTHTQEQRNSGLRHYKHFLFHPLSPADRDLLDHDPLSFFRELQEMDPSAELFCDFGITMHSISATEFDCERLFSAIDRIVGPYRTSLNDDGIMALATFRSACDERCVAIGCACECRSSNAKTSLK